ncbi:MAG: hypothetical protein DWQ10_06765 [Calditrichaeota bacterium]|nr:MAG: hypothetical protein DWQ10_06765 [Calditrichota bacterium]
MKIIDITHVRKTRNPLSSPALSLDRLHSFENVLSDRRHSGRLPFRRTGIFLGLLRIRRYRDSIKGIGSGMTCRD